MMKINAENTKKMKKKFYRRTAIFTLLWCATFLNAVEDELGYETIVRPFKQLGTFVRPVSCLSFVCIVRLVYVVVISVWCEGIYVCFELTAGRKSLCQAVQWRLSDQIQFQISLSETERHEEKGSFTTTISMICGDAVSH